MITARTGPTIVILSCNYGGGHTRVAEVLAEELRRVSPGCRVEIYDYIDSFVGRFRNIVFTSCYFGSVRWVPWLYRWFYRATSSIPPDSFVQRWINHLGKQRLASFLNTRRPDLVVCTYCLPAGAFSELKGDGRTDLPCATVITDHAVHSQWLHPNVDLYLVSSARVRTGVLERGLPPRRVLATGIPVVQAFTASPGREHLRRQYGIDPALPTILVMVGAYNLLRGALGVYECLVDLNRPVQLLFVCGRDEVLRRSIADLARGANCPVRVFGYVREIPELMALSDVMVSKAGGVTTSEALAAELPMVIIHPIPGQEEDNAAFLQEVGAALVAPTLRDLPGVVSDLLADHERLACMRHAARRVKRPDAARQGVAAMLALIDLPPHGGDRRTPW
jgi:processive 1,2-diacylglycerol beta-glucosyltransferase